MVATVKNTAPKAALADFEQPYVTLPRFLKKQRYLRIFLLNGSQGEKGVGAGKPIANFGRLVIAPHYCDRIHAVVIRK